MGKPNDQRKKGRAEKDREESDSQDHLSYGASKDLHGGELTKGSPLEKGTANQFSILALRTL